MDTNEDMDKSVNMTEEDMNQLTSGSNSNNVDRNIDYNETGSHQEGSKSSTAPGSLPTDNNDHDQHNHHTMHSNDISLQSHAHHHHDPIDHLFSHAHSHDHHHDDHMMMFHHHDDHHHDEKDRHPVHELDLNHYPQDEEIASKVSKDLTPQEQQQQHQQQQEQQMQQGQEDHKLPDFHHDDDHHHNWDDHLSSISELSSSDLVGLTGPSSRPSSPNVSGEQATSSSSSSKNSANSVTGAVGDSQHNQDQQMMGQSILGPSDSAPHGIKRMRSFSTDSTGMSMSMMTDDEDDFLFAKRPKLSLSLLGDFPSLSSFNHPNLTESNLNASSSTASLDTVPRDAMATSSATSTPTAGTGLAAPIMGGATIGIPPPPPANLKMPDDGQDSSGRRSMSPATMAKKQQNALSSTPTLEDMESGGKKSKADSKKKRLTWTPELHNMFVEAVHHLGVNNAAPKTIHQYMNVPYLTTEHIKSHLQKYRLQIKKQYGSQQPNMPSSSSSLTSATPSTNISSSNISTSSATVPSDRSIANASLSGINSEQMKNKKPASATGGEPIAVGSAFASIGVNKSSSGSASATTPSSAMTGKKVQQQSNIGQAVPTSVTTDTTNLFGLPNMMGAQSMPNVSSAPDAGRSSAMGGTSTSTVPSGILPPLLQQTILSGDDGTYDGYVQIMNYMAKEDADIRHMLEDSHAYIRNPDDYRLLLMGFKMGIFGGMKINNSAVNNPMAAAPGLDVMGQMGPSPASANYAMPGAWTIASAPYISNSSNTSSGTSRQTTSQDALTPLTPGTTRIQLKQTAPGVAPSGWYHQEYPQSTFQSGQSSNAMMANVQQQQQQNQSPTMGGKMDMNQAQAAYYPSQETVHSMNTGDHQTYNMGAYSLFPTAFPSNSSANRNLM